MNGFGPILPFFFPTWAYIRDAFLRKFETVIDQRNALIGLLQLKQSEDETITEFMQRFKFVKDRCDAARLEENTIFMSFVESLQERVLREVLMQDSTTVQQAMDASVDGG